MWTVTGMSWTLRKLKLRDQKEERRVFESVGVDRGELRCQNREGHRPHRARFGRDEFGVYEYVDGTVHKLEKMDIDFVNYGDLVKLLESLGYPKFKCMKWYDAAEDDLELRLHKLEGDKHVNEMCDYLMRHIELVDEFHIYVEHEVDVPIPAGEDFVQNVEPNVDTVILEDDTSLLLPH
ncbi:hypothetical protein PIB30_056118 [Stylosanthes scabra]|uniref:PB1-like domain-containing protein n=1 Tax=Stylosanthes scabra TaxID=79078 RepID=A0ABU6QIQ0_9FABA|nr:hypothetical protein [Stylosanthes scabra]